MMFEKDHLIDGKHHKECSLEVGWIARHEGWPLMFLFVFDWIIEDMISQKSMYPLGTVSFTGMMAGT